MNLDASGGELRHQLLHGTASAIHEAQRFSARSAVMLVHSFSPTNEWFDDFATFARLLGAPAIRVDEVVGVGSRAGVDLHVGWVKGDETYLNA